MLRWPPICQSVVRAPDSYDIRVLMKILRFTFCFGGLLLLASCAEEPQPVSVSQFVENPRLLEATMVRCAQNRSETKYDAECVNAREAINRVEAVQEKTRRAELEKQSERKRQALRRTQEAAAAARERAIEEQRRREEAEYMGLFETIPDANGPVQDSQMPVVGEQNAAPVSAPPPTGNAVPQAVDQPVADTANQAEETAMGSDPDLSAIREELKRRQQTPQQ